jgi:dihydrofolate reductase
VSARQHDIEEDLMRKLISFMVITADGFTEGPEGEFDWPNVDEGFNEFAVSQIHDLGALLFGRVTYEGMASYWPTPQALEDDPVVTDLMNRVPKYVFSHTLSSADWANTTLVSGEAGPAVAKLKEEDGYDLAVLGSARLTASLIEQGLVDELRVMVNPVLLGGGVSLYSAITQRVPLTLLRTTVFPSGNVLLVYRP